MTSPTAPPPRAPAPRRSRKALAAAAAVGLALAAAGAWWLLIRDSGPPPGPLSSPEATSISVRRHVGVPFGFGEGVAWNTGDRPAVLRSIRLVNPTPGLHVVDTRVAGPDRDLLSLASTFEWPTDEFGDTEPVRGFVVAPMNEPDGERGVELIFGLRADRAGRYESKAIAVEYTVGGEEHVAYIRNGIGVCVIPPSERIGAGRCPPPTGLTDPITED